MNLVILSVLLLCTISLVLGDVYMHNPKGSNNRLNSESQNTRNDRRIFDSQNNNNGGYLNCPDGDLIYYSKSLLQIEWTVQHGCGGGNTMHQKVDCNIVLQYMCGDNVRDGVRDEDNPTLGNDELLSRKMADPDMIDDATGEFLYGQHEPKAYYDACRTRERNKGLFIADRNLNENIGARATRQNNNGQQHGFECPEERDYYPYWHPTPWKDIAILTGDRARCGYYKKYSQNVRDKNYCAEDPEGTIPSKYNNEIACTENGHFWLKQKSWGIGAPACESAGWTRVNHLGNARENQGYSSSYLWMLPNVGNGEDGEYANCVLRLRYNISSHDYQPFANLDDEGDFIDYEYNGKASPVKNNPYVYFGNRNLSLAINTAQFGRTFQDRSHTFSIKSREGLGLTAGTRIYNLNVRGKRGNIVQAYPNVEYDFTPNELEIKIGDAVHFQWCGADTNPNNYDGEGTDGTDRSNIVQMDHPRLNHPLPLYREDRMDEDPELQDMFDDDVALLFAHLDQPGYCQSIDQDNCCYTVEQLYEKHPNDANDREEDPQNCAKLNYASATFRHPPIRFSKPGTYHYMSTRNNNFTNRSQKATLTVRAHLDWQAVAVSIVVAVLFVSGVVIFGGVYYARSHPGSALENIFQNA